MDEPSDTVEQTPEDVFRTAIFFEIALGGLALVLGWMLGPDARALIPKLESANLPEIGMACLYGVVAAIPILIAIEILKRIPWEPVRELERLGDDGILQMLLSLNPLELVAISLCAGVGEELLFRGWLLPWMAGGSLDAGQTELIAAMIGSSIAFGLVHPITKLYAVLAALMGLYFAWLLVFSGNLLVPILAHATYDAAQLMITSWQTHRKESD